MNIFVTGATSSSKYGMEFHNLGNFIIAEPLFEQLRMTFPGSRISTSIQMTDEFYKRHNLVGCAERRFWTYGLKTGIETAKDIFKVLLWKVSKRDSLLTSPLLSEIYHADLVIDFSGDIYGDNASWTKFLETNARLIMALLMKKKVAMLIGSPGPFSRYWRQMLAKFVLPKLDLITNREPLSTAMLAYVGIKGEHIYSTACPSVLFSAAKSLPDNEDKTRLEENKKTIGVIVCGWNMPDGPFNKWPREDREFDWLIGLIKWIVEESDYRVCVMAHQNGTDENGELVPGNDHRIINRLFELMPQEWAHERVFTLNGLYDAAQSKKIISYFELLVSGRIHGAVQGLSQAIPTLIVDYGHEPKAHKLQGFARVYGVDDYVCEPENTNDMKSKLEQLISRQEVIRKELEQRLSRVKSQALENFSLIKKVVERS